MQKNLLKMKHHNHSVVYILLLILSIIALVLVSSLLTDNPINILPQARTAYTFQTNDLGLASYEDAQSTVHFSFSTQNPTVGLYSLEDTSTLSVQKFLGEDPQYTFNGVSGDLIPDDPSNLRLVEKLQDDEMPSLNGFDTVNDDSTHYYYEQTRCSGVPVYGTTMQIHVNPNSDVYAVSGSFIRNTTRCRETITSSEAEKIARDAFRNDQNEEGSTLPGTEQFVYSPRLAGEEDGQNYLTYRTEVCGEIQCFAYFVDADTGEIRAQNTLTADAKNRKVSYRGTTRRESDSPVSSTLVNKGFDILGEVYDFYANTYQRDSWDDRGGILDMEIADCAEVNAYWTPQNTMYVCTEVLLDDVIAHEITHGVTGATTNLQYDYESGALNESLSDVAAAVVDSEDWTIGEEWRALRSMSNPPSGSPQSPDSMFSRFYYCATGPASKSNDYGGVHINSGVFNKAFYLMADGGTFPQGNDGCSLSPLGREKPAEVVYKTMTTYIRNTPYGNYKNMYDGMVNACNDVFGSSSSECQNIVAAMQAVGMDKQTLGRRKSPKCDGTTSFTPTCSGNAAPTAGPTTQPTGSQSPTPQVTSNPGTPTPTTSIPTATPEPTHILTSPLKTSLAVDSIKGDVTVTYDGTNYRIETRIPVTFAFPTDEEEIEGLPSIFADLANLPETGEEKYELPIYVRLVNNDESLYAGPLFLTQTFDIESEFVTGQDVTQYGVLEIYVIDYITNEETVYMVSDLNRLQAVTGNEPDMMLDVTTRLQGITSQPYLVEGVRMRVGVGGGNLDNIQYRDAVFTPDASGYWSGSVPFNIPPRDDYVLYIKGPMHSQKKYCENIPSESASGLYLCQADQVVLNIGNNALNFTGVTQPAGDINQDGRVNAVDINGLRQRIGSQYEEDFPYGDVNYDGIINAVDDSLVIFSLTNRPEQT